MERKVTQIKPAGANLIRMNVENGYGTCDYEKFLNNGSGTYDPQAKSADPINYSGMEDWGQEKYSGGSPLPRLNESASGTGQKDSIKPMGKTGESISGAY
jgi:hypothetical protein